MSRITIGALLQTQQLLGFTGSRGDLGYTGSTGGLGYTGSQGAGFTGSQGIEGYTGSAGVGFTGSVGTQGAVGFTGSVGTQGTVGYTGSQGDIGFTGSSGVGFTGSQGVQGTQGAIGYTGSSGTGGGTAITVGTKTMEYTGTLVTFTGTKRWWINSNVSISRLLAYITTAPQGSNVQLVINKNASAITSVNIQANTNSTISSANIPVVQGDYITVDVAQVGSSTAGADLALIFEYS